MLTGGQSPCEQKMIGRTVLVNQKNIIYELKPYNPRNIRRGIKQLEKYKVAFEARYNKKWETFLEFY